MCIKYRSFFWIFPYLPPFPLLLLPLFSVSAIALWSEDDLLPLDGIFRDLLDSDTLFQDYESALSEVEGRGIFETGDTYNTSTSFVMPVFHFNVPEFYDIIDGNHTLENFGVLGYGTIYLVGVIATAIYMNQADPVSFFNSRQSRHVTTGWDLIDGVVEYAFDFMAGLPEALDVESCGQTAVCAAHADPQRYGLIGMLIRMHVPSMLDVQMDSLSPFQKAARYGYDHGRGECRETFPCLLQPLDLLS